ncbi:MAG: acylphosphatase [Pseudomonadota bacterium]
MTRSVRLTIRGRVQGVGYRAWAGDAARALGLAGWVRNRTDGTVEAVASGDDGAIERFIAACGQGPGMARVTAVEAIDISAAEVDGPGFEYRPTI